MDNKQLKVLLIEGKQQVAEEIKKELLEQGFVVSVSLTTENGLLRARAHQFDMFIVNSEKDGKQGLSFANSLLKLEQYKNPDFIFVFSPNVKVDVRLRKFDKSFDIIKLPFDETEFRIRINNLLNKTVNNVDQNKHEESKKADENVAHSGKVLLVEDNPLNQKVLGMFITRLGFNFDIASNGQMAVDLCTNMNYPFILMDIYMPGMDGTEATEKIRQMEEQSGYRAKIIAITANESEESVKRCYDSGMDDYLVKPFTLEVLKEKLV